MQKEFTEIYMLAAPVATPRSKTDYSTKVTSLTFAEEHSDKEPAEIAEVSDPERKIL